MIESLQVIWCFISITWEGVVLLPAGFLLMLVHFLFGTQRERGEGTLNAFNVRSFSTQAACESLQNIFLHLQAD